MEKKVAESSGVLMGLGLGCAALIILIALGSGIASIILVVFGSICIGTNDFSLCLQNKTSAIVMLVFGLLLFLCCCCSITIRFQKSKS